MAFPVSCAIILASCSVFASIASAILSSSRPLSDGMVRLHLSNAVVAATTASSTSEPPDRGTWAMTFVFAGHSAVMLRPSLLPTHAPPINCLVGPRVIVESAALRAVMCVMFHPMHDYCARLEDRTRAIRSIKRQPAALLIFYLSDRTSTPRIFS